MARPVFLTRKHDAHDVQLPQLALRRESQYLRVVQDERQLAARKEAVRGARRAGTENQEVGFNADALERGEDPFVGLRPKGPTTQRDEGGLQRGQHGHAQVVPLALGECQDTARLPVQCKFMLMTG